MLSWRELTKFLLAFSRANIWPMLRLTSFPDIHFEPNYKEMWLRNQNIISYNNKRENAKQVEYDYAVGHYAYILRDKNYRKLEGERLGPFRITQVHTNGYFRIQRGIINAQINTRRLTHHFGDPPS